MSIGITKAIAGVSVLAGTGAVLSENINLGSSSVLLSSAKEDSSISKTSSSKQITPLQGKCRIWEVTLGNGSYRVTRIVQEITNRDELVNDADPGNERFRAEIRDACAGKKDTRVKVDDYIYIYISRLGGRWAYSSVVQHYNWHADNQVAK
ncbi:hypothetical protein MHC_04180 [Mycoplasma haemocanis str. Illinois]|uniref:Uncharacterized protein n=1 Tax=Mycoplasma haemocanis (strain Illinois) TaxID=1111676 RepID=H6N7S0_MYCHN|nr:hypothetical protein [Mycoplasma haemocanis]AEW45692.1 hypothetical protein MHC_04180 [Mycoplasma haemocanis str. Illinois]